MRCVCGAVRLRPDASHRLGGLIGHVVTYSIVLVLVLRSAAPALQTS